MLGLAANCNNGCVGSGRYDAKTTREILSKALDTPPFTIPVDGEPWLHLLLTVPGDDGRRALAAGCLRVLELTLTDDRGDKHNLAAPSTTGYLAALNSDESAVTPPPSPRACERS